MNSNNRTLAFQVSEEFFQRVKDYLTKHPKLKQRICCRSDRAGAGQI